MGDFGSPPSSKRASGEHVDGLNAKQISSEYVDNPKRTSLEPRRTSDLLRKAYRSTNTIGSNLQHRDIMNNGSTISSCQNGISSVDFRRAMSMMSPEQSSLAPSSSSSRSEASLRLSTRLRNTTKVLDNSDVGDEEVSQMTVRIRGFKHSISIKSKKNFLLERDARYLEDRISLLIQNKIAIDHRVAEITGSNIEDEAPRTSMEEKKRVLYGQLFHLIQNEPRFLSELIRHCTLAEMDKLLETVMFTVFGNQYDDENLLLSMIQNVLSWHIEGSEMSSILRANTQVSRLLMTYTRRGPGQAYLKECLSPLILTVLENETVDLDIEPLKVYESLVKSGSFPANPHIFSSEDAYNVPQVRETIVARAKILEDLSQKFLDGIIGSLSQIPFGLRWICKEIRTLCRRRFPDVTDEQICSLLGGLFLLRFVNPAIVTPQAYMLINSSVTKHPRRTLTLIAKVLQNLANKPSLLKEQYMNVMNPFFERNKHRFSKFLLDVCIVGDFHDSLEVRKS